MSPRMSPLFFDRYLDGFAQITPSGVGEIHPQQQRAVRFGRLVHATARRTAEASGDVLPVRFTEALGHLAYKRGNRQSF
jgi:hypothetical protein